MIESLVIVILVLILVVVLLSVIEKIVPFDPNVRQLLYAVIVIAVIVWLLLVLYGGHRMHI